MRGRVSLAMMTALLALAAGTVGLVFDLKPELRPDPRERQAASVRVVAVDHGITLGEYLERIDAVGTGDYSHCELRLPGSLAYVEVAQEGFKRRDTELRFFTYSKTAGARLAGEPSSVSGGSAPVSTFTSEAPFDQSVSLQWIQWPYRDERVLVRFELYHLQDGALESLLAVGDTRPYVVTRRRYCELIGSCLESCKFFSAP